MIGSGIGAGVGVAAAPISTISPDSVEPIGAIIRIMLSASGASKGIKSPSSDGNEVRSGSGTGVSVVSLISDSIGVVWGSSMDPSSGPSVDSARGSVEGACDDWVPGSASVSININVAAAIDRGELVFPSSKVSVGAGSSDGGSIGTAVGTAVGARVGISVGTAVGTAVGTSVGSGVGTAVGTTVGSGVGTAVGTAVGTSVGSGVGTAVGASVMTTSEGCIDTGTPWLGGDPSAVAASG